MLLSGNATAVVLDADSGTVLDPDTDTEVQGNLQIVYAGFATPTARRAGRLHQPQPGHVLDRMNGGDGNPLIVNRT